MENNENKAVYGVEPVAETSAAEAKENIQNRQTPPQNNFGGYAQNPTGAPVRPCPICGTEYTYVCPKCGFSPYVGRTNTKKSIFSKWWFWLIAAVVAFSLIIGAAGFAIFLIAADDTSTVGYTGVPLCSVGEVEVELVPDLSYRDEYNVVLSVKVKNNGDKDVSFYPTKAMLDGISAIAYGDFHYEDTDMMWDYDSYYAKDGSTIIKKGNSHLLEFTFSYEDEWNNENTSSKAPDYRDIEKLVFSINVADSENGEVLNSEVVTFDLSRIESQRKYYEYE